MGAKTKSKNIRRCLLILFLIFIFQNCSVVFNRYGFELTEAENAKLPASSKNVSEGSAFRLLIDNTRIHIYTGIYDKAVFSYGPAFFPVIPGFLYPQTDEEREEDRTRKIELNVYVLTDEKNVKIDIGNAVIEIYENSLFSRKKLSKNCKLILKRGYLADYREDKYKKYDEEKKEYVKKRVFLENGKEVFYAHSFDYICEADPFSFDELEISGIAVILGEKKVDLPRLKGVKYDYLKWEM